MIELVTYIFFSSSILMLLLVILLIFRQLYQISKEPAILKKMRRLRKPVQPWVTVIVYCQSKTSSVDATVASLLRNRYYYFDIVVVLDQSKDAKRAILKAYKKSNKGTIVITMLAGAIVPKSFIKRAVVTINDTTKANVRCTNPIVLNSFTDIIQSLCRQFLLSDYKIMVSDAKHSIPPTRTVRFDYVAVLLFLIVIPLSFYISEPVIILYGWLIITGYLLAVIWMDDQKLKIKFGLSYAALSAFFVVPVAKIVLYLSQLPSRN